MPRTLNGGTEFDPAALERTEARFWREIWDAAPDALGVAKGIRRAEFGPVQATVIAALPEVRMLNLILGGAGTVAAAEGFLEEAAEWTRAQGVRGFALLEPQPASVDPAVDPAPRAIAPPAERALAGAGFEQSHAWMRFVRDAHPPRFKVAAEVEVREVDGSDEEAPFGSIAALGLGLPAWTASLFAPLPALPDWRCYLALVDGEPQACAAVLLDGEVAELGLMATLEGGRRRGCATALLGRGIEDATSAGARTLFVDTVISPPSEDRTAIADVRGAGFQAAYLLSGWTDARPAAS